MDVEALAVLRDLDPGDAPGVRIVVDPRADVLRQAALPG
jgi:hypothetical protein